MLTRFAGFLAALLSALLAHTAAEPKDLVSPASTPMLLINHCGADLQVEWINEATGERVSQSAQPLHDAGHFTVNTYKTHLFAVSEIYGTAEVQHRHTGAHETLVLDRNLTSGALTLTLTTPTSDARDAARTIAARCAGDADCLERELAAALAERNEQRAVEAKLRDTLGAKFRDPLCAGLHAGTVSSTPVTTERWTFEDAGVAAARGLKVETHLNHSHAGVQLIRGFVTPKECARIVEVSTKRGFSRATVSGEDGAATVSDARRADQADVVARADDTLLQGLRRRLFAYLAAVDTNGGPAGFYDTIADDGQEHLIAIRCGALLKP